MSQLSADALRHAAQTRLLGQVIHYCDEVDSTTAALFRLIKEGAPEGTVVIADAQKVGRGRLGKQWFSPPGISLYLSIFLKPPLQFAETRLYTLLGSLALFRPIWRTAQRHSDC